MAKVMLVEDDNNLREIYEARMQAEGYDVVSAKDGEEALVVAKAEKPELIISDVMMPKISGFEMLDILRNTEGMQDVKVIMLTALGQADDQQRADRLGADRYLVKSQVTLEDIVNVAHQLLGDNPEAVAETPVAPAPTEPAELVPTVPIAAAPAPTEPAAVPAAAAPVVTPESATVVTASPGTPAVEAANPVTPLSSSGFSAVQVEPPPAAAAPAAAAPISSPPTASDSSDAQSTAQEEAAVEAQIESFVSGVTEAPAAESAVAPVNLVSVAANEAATNSAADDKILAEAVNTLTSAVAETTAVAPPVAPAGGPIPASTAAPAPEVSTSGVAGKKIISPLSGVNARPNLNALLAQEEAKEILVATASAPAEPTTNTPPAAATPPVLLPDSGDKPDPNSISL